MSIIEPFALRLEAFVYERLCALSLLWPPDGSDRSGTSAPGAATSRLIRKGRFGSAAAS